jgi:hypothetical protein
MAVEYLGARQLAALGRVGNRLSAQAGVGRPQP